MKHNSRAPGRVRAGTSTRRQLFKQLGLAVAGAVLACQSPKSVAVASEPTFQDINFPGAVATLATDINNSGQIVGRYVDTAGRTHGFLLSAGTFSRIQIPGISAARPLGINRHGTIVGHYINQGQQERGFLLSGGDVTLIDVPEAAKTWAVGINSGGEIAGYYVDARKNTRGFILSAGTYTTIDYPGAKTTEVWRINDSGQIAGRYVGSDRNYHLFRLQNGTFESLDVPGAVQTAPGGYSHVGGLNNLGDIASTFASASPYGNLSNPNVYGNVHGLLFSDGVFAPIDPPGAVETVACGVNDFRQVVGIYTDANGMWHGYLRMP